MATVKEYPLCSRDNTYIVLYVSGRFVRYWPVYGWIQSI